MNRKYTVGISEDGLVKLVGNHSPRYTSDEADLHTVESFELANVLAEANLSDEDWDGMSEASQYQVIKNYYEHIVRGSL